MTDRRDFIKLITLGGLAAGAGISPFSIFAGGRLNKITILHTNDTHSQIEPLPATDTKFPGMGGFSRRAAMIKKIRVQEENVLLFDAGDVFTGSPFFNFFKGELEYKLMSEMGYNAGTIGNHEFDNGLDELAKQSVNARFSLISSNYDFTGTAMNGKTEKYKIIDVNGIKTGIYGLGPQLEGLVDKKLYVSTVYTDPIETARKMETILKHDHHCDYIICLSHIGYDEKTYQPSDVLLSQNTSFTQLIIGGHSHTFLDKADTRKNKKNKAVDIVQVGWGGLKLGRYDIIFNENKKIIFCQSNTLKIFKNQV